jgi:RNA polymerase sigma-70 factor (ECF subfamily)
MHQEAGVNEARLPDGDAINELFSQHYKVSLRTAYRILRSKEDSEDAVQTAYCAAFRHLQHFRGESSFKTWITRIVVNCCLMQLRERRARLQVALDEILPGLTSHALTPETLCYLRELQVAHTTAASTLPPNLKDVYGPCLIDDIGLSTVAHHLGLTATAAKSRLFRARRKVERVLQSAIQRRAA